MSKVIKINKKRMSHYFDVEFNPKNIAKTIIPTPDKINCILPLSPLKIGSTPVTIFLNSFAIAFYN